MKKYILLLAILILGILAGMWGCRSYYINREVDAQRDTIYQKVIQSYGGLELQANTIKLDIPKFDIPNFYYFVIDSTKIEYKDSLVYVVLPSESYHTRVGGIDIFHSGVRSQIDSVNAEYYTSRITEKYRVKEKKHSITLYGSIGWMDRMRMPVGGKYLYYPFPWLGVGGKVEHDFAIRTTGVYATTELTFGW